MSEEEAAQAAALEAAGDGAAPESAAGADRVLNQEEIDSLLGFDGNSDQVQDKSGVRAIINSALVSY